MRKPSQVGYQLLWLCDLRSREVCLSRFKQTWLFTPLKTGEHQEVDRVAALNGQSTLQC